MLLKVFACALPNCYSEQIRKVGIVIPWRDINETPPLTVSFEYIIFLGEGISRNSSKPLSLKGFYLLRMSNDYCFRSVVQGQLSQGNRRNYFLRPVIKSHKGLKGAEVFAFGCSVTNLKNFSKLTGKIPCWSLFIAKLQPEIAYKKGKNKDYSDNFIIKETPTQRLWHK